MGVCKTVFPERVTPGKPGILPLAVVDEVVVQILVKGGRQKIGHRLHGPLQARVLADIQSRVLD